MYPLPLTLEEVHNDDEGRDTRGLLCQEREGPGMHDDCPEKRGARLKRGRGLPRMHNDCPDERGDRLMRGRGRLRMHNDSPVPVKALLSPRVLVKALLSP